MRYSRNFNLTRSLTHAAVAGSPSETSLKPVFLLPPANCMSTGSHLFSDSLPVMNIWDSTVVFRDAENVQFG